MKKMQLGILVLLITCIVVLNCPAAAQALMSIDVTDSQDPVMAFMPYSYSIDYAFISDTASGGLATIIDQLPPEVSFISATDSGIYDSATHSVRWDVGDTLGSSVSVTVNPDRIPIPACMVTLPPVTLQNTATISWSTDSQTDTESTTILEPIPVCGPEFPSTLLPATMIIGFLGSVLFIQRTREH